MGQSLFSFSKPFFIAISSIKLSKLGFWGCKRRFCSALISLFALSSLAQVCRADLSNDRFGKINIYKPEKAPTATVMLFSGDGGFDGDSEILAKKIADSGLLVIGINTPRYLEGVAKDDVEEDCSYLAGEITRLSQAAQSTEKLDSYKKPLLMGIQSGAALAYSIATQYPYEFTGLVTVGFCPQVKVTPLLCEGEGLSSTLVKDKQTLNYKSRLKLEWRDFSSQGLSFCDLQATSKFFNKDLDQVQTILSKGERKIEIADPWFLQLLSALRDLSQDEEQESGLEEAVSDLPLVELSPEKRLHDSLVFIVSGDGGWATIDKELGEYFMAHGYEVLGFNALKYFWQKKTPDETAADINRALRFYRTKLGIDNISLVGFSLGADVLPFVVNRLSEDNRTDISLVALLSPGKTTDFEIHVADWLGIEGAQSALDVTAEIKKITRNKLLCLYGTDDEDQTCTLLNPKIFLQKSLPGDHHFDGDYETVARLILEAGAKQ